MRATQCCLQVEGVSKGLQIVVYLLKSSHSVHQLQTFARVTMLYRWQDSPLLSNKTHQKHKWQMNLLGQVKSSLWCIIYTSAHICILVNRKGQKVVDTSQKFHKATAEKQVILSKTVLWYMKKLFLTLDIRNFIKTLLLNIRENWRPRFILADTPNMHLQCPQMNCSYLPWSCIIIDRECKWPPRIRTVNRTNNSLTA